MHRAHSPFSFILIHANLPIYTLKQHAHLPFYFILNMQTYLFYFSKTCSLTFSCSLTFFVFWSIDIPLFRNFHLNLNPFSDIPSGTPVFIYHFLTFPKKNDIALSLTLDIFIKLPSLKAYCPNCLLYLIFFSFSSLQTKFGEILQIYAYLLLILIRSELFKNGKVDISSQFQSIVNSLYNWILNN